jgi:rfaE bifunctional protein nucleotidyltransferase chain/domain
VIVSLAEAQDRRERARASGLLCVVANGAFDLLHVGHLRYLEAAKALVQSDPRDRSSAADGLLFVGVNSDASVRASKGPSRPIIPAAERAELVDGLRCVDLVVLFEEETASELLRALRPDIHAKGTDYTVENVPERALVESLGGRTVICGDAKDHSTTATAAILRGAKP